MSKPRKLETQRGRFRICRCNFKVNKFGNLSLLGKSVLFLREPFQSVGKKGFLRSNSLLISSERLEWKLLKTCVAIFETCLSSLCSKN